MVGVSEFEELIQQVRSCTLCSLSRKRNRAVPGEGPPSADILFVGEGPGFHEDQQGRPFVGAAGQLLEKLLNSIGLRRQEVYITNMVKCRPPNNRDPLPSEIQACRPYLDRQLDLVAPKVVVTLGRYSLARFFPNETIGKARGIPRKWNGLTVYPVYHPAAALRSSKLRETLEKDFQMLPTLLESSPENTNDTQEKQVTQLNLF